MFAGMTPASLYGHVPESVFAMFQFTFAIVTSALIVGAVAERMKFSALLVVVAVWFTAVYLPMAHMVWGEPGSFLGDLGVLDFASGTVVHINAGIAGLVACLMLGRRRGCPHVPMPPHNLGYTLICFFCATRLKPRLGSIASTCSACTPLPASWAPC